MAGPEREMEEVEETEEGQGRTEFPRFPLKRTLKIAEAIEKYNAGRPYDRLDIASALNISPNSSGFRLLIVSSRRYGLTEGGYQADKLALTSLGSSIVAPTREGQREAALKQALAKPELFRKVFSHYDKKALPPESILKNSLRKEFGVSPKDVDPCYEVLMTNIRDYSLVQNIKGTEYLQLDKLSAEAFAGPGEPVIGELEYSPPASGEEDLARAVSRPHELPVQKPRKIFIAHGKNKKPLEQLERILNQFKVPHIVATEEPHKGRPINSKVADLMKDCTSGIFIFTADEETIDAQGNKVLRPSDNVVFELGAGILQYGDKIVILREEGVSFGSDFTAYGHITFDKNNLDAKAFDLMKELIGLGFLQVTPT